jgi:long-subunit fatty acid transport protein
LKELKTPGMYKLYKSKVAIILIGTLLYGKMSNCQRQSIYPPFTKWYQDPLGLKPLELSTAFGFVWGAASVAACLIVTKKDSAFLKRVSIYQEAGFGFGYKPPYTSVFQNEVGLMYSVRKWMALGVGLNTFHFKDKIKDTWSFGIRPFARWYPYKTKKASLFFEYGAGFSYSLDRFPFTGTGLEADTARTGTRFNLTSKYGIGTEVYFNNRLSIQAGIRHFHLSNGNLAGIKRNPSHDSNGFFVGLFYSPKNKTVAR